MEGSTQANSTQPPFIDLESSNPQNVRSWNSNASPFMPYTMPAYSVWHRPPFPLTMPTLYPPGSASIPTSIPSTASIPSVPEHPRIPLMEVKLEEAAKRKGTQRPRKTKRKLDLHDLIEEQVEEVKQGGPWKEHWVVNLITLRGELSDMFTGPPKQGYHVCHISLYIFLFI